MTQEPIVAGRAMGCALPANEALTAEGWVFRCNADSNRLREMTDTFEEMGYEVRLEPLNLEGLSETCGGCVGTLRGLSAIYIRRREKAAAPA